MLSESSVFWVYAAFDRNASFVRVQMFPLQKILKNNRLNKFKNKK